MQSSSPIKLIKITPVAPEIAIDMPEDDIVPIKILMTTCPICLDEYPPEKKTTVPVCKHSFCLQCISEYLKVQIRASKVIDILCPQSGCNTVLEEKIIKKVLGSEMYIRYCKILYAKLTNRDHNNKYCPKPQCSKLLKVSNKEEYTVCTCGTIVCNACGNFQHVGKTCIEAIDPKLEHFYKRNKIRRCILCQAPGKKVDGCNHITCPVCNFQWCWMCGRKYSLDHNCIGFWDPVVPKAPRELPTQQKTSSFTQKLLRFPSKICHFIGVVLKAMFCWPLLHTALGPPILDSAELSRENPCLSFLIIFNTIVLVLICFYMPIIFGICALVDRWLDKDKNESPAAANGAQTQNLSEATYSAISRARTTQLTANGARQIIESQRYINEHLKQTDEEPNKKNVDLEMQKIEEEKEASNERIDITS